MNERFPTLPASHLLSKFGILLILAGLILAAWYGQIVIVILLCLVLSAAGLSKLWSRYSLAGVSCQRLLSVRRAFPDEELELRLRLVNRKLLPLPWIRLDDEVPLRLFSDIPLVDSDSPGVGFLSKSAALLWYTGVSWKERLKCHMRGYYRLGPIRLTSGDIFGFYPRSITSSTIDHVIVYPKIYPITYLGIPSLHPLGDTTVTKRIFEDPLRVIGVRDYDPRDSLRYIHWKATARRQELQVKVFEPTTTLKVAIFLAIDTFQFTGPEDTRDFESGMDSNASDENSQPDLQPNEEDFELGISTAASIANHLIEQRNSVGLFINSRLADSGQPATILPGNGSGQLVEILEALAKATPSPSSSFKDFLEIERATLPWGTTLVFILYKPSQVLIEQLVVLKENGHKLMLLQIGSSEEEIQTSINCQYIGHPGDFSILNAGETG